MTAKHTSGQILGCEAAFELGRRRLILHYGKARTETPALLEQHSHFRVSAERDHLETTWMQRNYAERVDADRAGRAQYDEPLDGLRRDCSWRGWNRVQIVLVKPPRGADRRSIWRPAAAWR